MVDIDILDTFKEKLNKDILTCEECREQRRKEKQGGQ